MDALPYVTSRWMSGNETEFPDSITYLGFFGGIGHDESRDDGTQPWRTDRF